MPQGLQVWNAAGNLIVDTNTSLGIILGTHTITKSSGNGSLIVPNLALGTPFFLFVAVTASFFPAISISGTTISWVYDAFVNSVEPGSSTYTILYGYY